MAVTGLAVVLLAAAPVRAGLPKQVNVRASKATLGPEANKACSEQSVATKGRYVAFETWASNLVTGDTNNKSDIFVYEREAGVITRVSVGPAGAQANGGSYRPSISADGRFVAFESAASNLVTGDTNVKWDIFVHDRKKDVTTRVSLGPNGAQGDNDSYAPSISADGRFVAFESDATNLVAGDTNNECDIFVYDRKKEKTVRVSVASSGAQGYGYSYGPAISANGRFVAFSSFSDNLVAGDANFSRDVFVHDRKKGKTTRVSVASSGAQGNADSFSPSISGNGRYVAFESWAYDLVPGDSNAAADVFVHDRKKGKTKRISKKWNGQASKDSGVPSISKDGRYVAFTSWDGLLKADTNSVEDVYLYDRKQGKTRLISCANAPLSTVSLDMNASLPSISPDGGTVAFSSVCSYVVQGDTNGVEDVFLRRW